jgi:imidazoleglycerol-phosphate dehydratase
MREISIERRTDETAIEIRLNLDGGEVGKIQTGIGFFDHMLIALARHSGFAIDINCQGDLHVDCHHTVEDIGIVLGTAFAQLTKDKTGLARYGSFTVPMDEALAHCHVDISGRPYLVFNCDFRREKMGQMDSQLIREFFYAFAVNAKITLHINVPYGDNDHHKAEACFKAFAHALKQAVKLNDNDEILSTKGCLA